MSEGFPPAELPALREVIAGNGLAALKSLGQHFLLDANMTGKIVRTAGLPPGANVIEVGPGPGGLTRSLLAADIGRLIAIETDSRAVRALEGLGPYAGGRLELREADALAVDLTEYAALAPLHIVSNLPYNIGTPLLTGWLEVIRRAPGLIGSLTLMFQKEVAERILARPGTKAYGRLGVMTGWLCEGARGFDIPPQAFTPPPSVISTVIALRPRGIEGPEIPAFATMESLVRDAFGQRRKMLRSALKSYGDLLEACGIEGTRRAETLRVDEFVRMARYLERRQEKTGA